MINSLTYFQRSINQINMKHNIVRKKKFGFTLVETLIAVAMFGLLFTTIYRIYMNMQRQFGAGQKKLATQQAGENLMQYLKKDLEQFVKVDGMAFDSKTGVSSISGRNQEYVSYNDSDIGIYKSEPDENTVKYEFFRFKRSNNVDDIVTVHPSATFGTDTQNNAVIAKVEKVIYTHDKAKQEMYRQIGNSSGVLTQPYRIARGCIRMPWLDSDGTEKDADLIEKYFIGDFSFFRINVSCISEKKGVLKEERFDLATSIESKFENSLKSQPGWLKRVIVEW